MNHKRLIHIFTMLFLVLLTAVFSFTSKPISVDAAKKTTATSKKTSVSAKTESATTKKVALTTKITNWKASNLSSLENVLDDSLLDGFKELGFVVKVDKKEAAKYGYTGCFSPSRQKIILKKGSTTTLLHEMGHFLDFVEDYPSSNKEFQKIYKSEKKKAKSFYNTPSYTLSSPKEYFAESFNLYYSDPAKLKSKCPKTYNYMNKVAHSVTAEQIHYIQNRYGLY